MVGPSELDRSLQWLEKCVLAGWINRQEFHHQRHQLQRPLSFRGVVHVVYPIRSQVEVAAYQCKPCGHLTTVVQTGQFLKAPAHCPNCGVEGPFRFCEDQSTYQSSQTLLLIDKQTPPQTRPRLFYVQLTGNQTGTVAPGDQILVRGTLKVYVCTHREYGKQETFTTCLQVHTLKINASAQVKETP